MLKRIADWLFERAYGVSMQACTRTADERVQQVKLDWERDKASWKVTEAAKIKTNADIEALKLEFLNKGIERGRASMRTGTIFDLYLQRADPVTTDDGYARTAQMSMGVPMPAAGVKAWRWWAVVDETGHEVCLGPLDTMTYVQALQRYLDILPLAVRAEIGGHKSVAVAKVDAGQKETNQ